MDSPMDKIHTGLYDRTRVGGASLLLRVVRAWFGRSGRGAYRPWRGPHQVAGISARHVEGHRPRRQGQRLARGAAAPRSPHVRFLNRLGGRLLVFVWVGDTVKSKAIVWCWAAACGGWTRWRIHRTTASAETPATIHCAVSTTGCTRASVGSSRTRCASVISSASGHT